MEADKYSKENALFVIVGNKTIAAYKANKTDKSHVYKIVHDYRFLRNLPENLPVIRFDCSSKESLERMLDSEIHCMEYEYCFTGNGQYLPLNEYLEKVKEFGIVLQTVKKYLKTV